MNNDGELRKEKPFCTAIDTLQLLKTTFVPLEKFVILQDTFKRMEDVSKNLFQYKHTVSILM